MMSPIRYFLSILVCSLVPFGLYSQLNYVRTLTPLSALPPAGVSANNSITQTTYYDAALRPVQTIHHEAGVSHTALADLRRYDGAGRLQAYYLPQIAYSEGAFCAESEFDNAVATETCISYGYESSSLSREIIR